MRSPAAFQVGLGILLSSGVRKKIPLVSFPDWPLAHSSVSCAIFFHWLCCPSGRKSHISSAVSRFCHINSNSAFLSEIGLQAIFLPATKGPCTSQRNVSG